MKKSTTIKAAIYARFSTNLQKDTSVDDQFTLCERFAATNGYEIVSRFCDRAKTSSTMHGRAGLFDLREAAKRGEFDVVIAESFDRISRDLEDGAGFFKRLTHYGIDIITVNEGKANTIQVGLRGIMGQMFLKDLGDKVRRGHMGSVMREGLMPGAVPYGYDRVWNEAAREYKKGEREVYEPEANIVRRIFKEYAAGKTPREIAAGLTRDCVPTPNGGKEWSHNVLLGGKGCRGILNNRAYIGELIWNQCYFVADPDSERKIKRHRPESEHIKVDVPHMRIVDQITWNAVHATRASRSTSERVENRTYLPRNRHLLHGLLQCGVCQTNMVVTQKTPKGDPRMQCSASHYRQACEHTKSYDMSVIEATVVNGFKQNLVDAESIKEMTKAYHARRKENDQKNSGERTDTEKKLAKLTLNIDRIVSAISDTDEPVKALVDKLKKLEAERVGLTERLRLLNAENVIALHPSSIETYKNSVDILHRALLKGRNYGEAEKQAFRNLIDRVVVHPTGARKPYEVSVYGRLSALMGVEAFPNMRTVAEIVAEEAIPANKTAGGRD